MSIKKKSGAKERITPVREILLAALDSICRHLQCQPGDILEFRN